MDLRVYDLDGSIVFLRVNDVSNVFDKLVENFPDELLEVHFLQKTLNFELKFLTF